MQNLIAIFFLATFIEGTVKYVVDTLQVPTKTRVRPYKPYITMIIGIALSFNYHLDILQIFGLSNIIYSPLLFTNYIITGVIIGRGSNYLSDLVSKLRVVDKSDIVGGVNGDVGDKNSTLY